MTDPEEADKPLGKSHLQPNSGGLSLYITSSQILALPPKSLRSLCVASNTGTGLVQTLQKGGQEASSWWFSGSFYSN